MENYIGRVLGKSEVVHHVNGKRKDNRIENLRLMTISEHLKLHGKEHSMSYVDLVCPECNEEFIRQKRNTHLSKPGQKRTFCSRSCGTIYNGRKKGKEHKKNVVRVYSK